MLLGLLIQQVSGQPYEEYMHEHVFAPLQMEQASLDAAQVHTRGAATGHRYWFGVPVPGELATDQAALPSGGQMSASAEDVAHFVVAQLNGGSFGATSILSPQGIAEMQRPVDRQGAGAMFYAMDWGLEPIGGVPAVMKGGDNADFKTQIILFPERRLGLVVLINTNNRFSSFLGDPRIAAIAVNVSELLVGQAPTALPVANTPTLLYSALLLAVAVQAAGMVRTTLLLRRWQSQPAQRPTGWAALAVRIGLPLVGNLGWGLFALVGVTGLFRVPLSFIVYLAPDFGYTLIASGVVALGWGILRTALAFWVLRERDANRAIPTPATA